MADEKKKIKTIPKTIDELKKNIRAEHGAGAIMQGRDAIIKVDIFPTGVTTIDRALGCGGIPQGRIIEIFGHESSGKTTTCLHFVHACQHFYFEDKKRNGVAAFIDAEHAFDPAWAEKCGVKIDELLFSQPDSGEEAFAILESLVASGLVDLIIVDSVASMVPMKELESEYGDANIGGQARLMSSGLRKIKGIANNAKTTVVFVNQVRQKIGIAYGSPDTTPGGLALKFYSSIRMQINKGSAIKIKETTVGFRPTLKIIKNKCAAPFTSAEYEICVGTSERPVFGIDTLASMIEAGVEMGILTKKSSHFIFEDKNIGNGLNAATSFLRANPTICGFIKDKIYGSLTVSTVSTEDIDGELVDSILDDHNE